MKSVRSPLSSVELKDGIERFLAEDERPELERMHVVASSADIRADRMPAFQCAYLAHRLDT